MGGVWQISLCGCRGQLILHNETDGSENNLEFYSLASQHLLQGCL